MKFNDLEYGQAEVFYLEPATAETVALEVGQGAAVTWSAASGHYIVRQHKRNGFFRPRSQSDAVRLQDFCSTGAPKLWWIGAGPQDAAAVVTLHGHRFPLRLDGLDLELGLDDQILQKAKKSGAKQPEIDAVRRWLHLEFVLEGYGRAGSESYVFLSAGGDDVSEVPGAFVLHGKTMLADVRQVDHPGGTGKAHLITRFRRKRQQRDVPIHLVSGTVVFDDLTQVGLVRKRWEERFGALTSTDSFIKLWERYGTLEVEDILEQARAVGTLAYDGWEPVDEGIRFKIALAETKTRIAALMANGLLKEKVELAVWTSTPSHLFAEPSTFVMTADERRQHGRDAADEDRAVASAPIIEVRDWYITLALERVSPPPKGLLTLSVSGDQVRLRRRREAQLALHGGRAAMPHIGFLLEGEPWVHFNRESIDAPSARVWDKLFADHPPTPRQKEAIEVALNTPDIALIQGPPGTGKTTVIRAILERLNEVARETGGVCGRFLLSGFQHDAVENAAGRMDLNGLPPIKFGSRGAGGDGETDVDQAAQWIDAWRQERVAALLEKSGLLREHDVLRKVADLLTAYVLLPETAQQAAHRLREAAEAAGAFVPARLCDEAHELADRLEREFSLGAVAQTEQGRLLRAARALRTEEAAYHDDGPLNSARFLYLIRASDVDLDLTDDDTGLLDRAAAGYRALPEDPWKALAGLRRRLLRRLTPAPRSLRLQPVHLEDVEEMLVRLRDALEAHFGATVDGRTGCMATYVRELDQYPGDVRHAIIEYSAVFAATCQQSARGELAEAKTSAEADYDSAIIDEAARANPLDLFIPMTKARRRIILVGDHRQLPHLIEDKLARQLEADVETRDEAGAGDVDVSARVQDEIKRSLFERLFEDFRHREIHDGEPKRTVTLDAQFRMHPLLGDFVSKHFYEVHGEPRIDSPLPATLFQQALPGVAGKAAVWVDVPRSQGEEARAGTSRIRACEAQVVADVVLRFLEHDRAEGLNIGVITFYKNQVREIEAALAERDLMEPDEGGGFRVVPELSVHRNREGERASGEAHLRVGTVDAFQGREFDVVLLSMVRSNAVVGQREAQRRRKWGHLMSPNRLNVSMSRQKRLLVVVGDRAMLRGPHAADAIQPLVAFEELAQQSPLGHIGTYEELFR